MRRMIAVAAVIFVLAAASHAQVVSPKVMTSGQVDTTDLRVLAEGIYKAAGAVTPRQKAEAIWRFFLTDGRFVPQRFWYHIAGWAYEEPGGEVLDPIRLLNSYGFGLCYQIAPLLQAVYLAGGFEDARVWFLTGHTVTEVFYDGAYHHYDSDMLGYSTIGTGDPRKLPVASVSQIAQDGTIMTGKLKSPKEVDPAKVDNPWYPADVAEAAIDGLAEAFTTRSDNWLFTGTRYPLGHSMDYVLRPGEKIIRYFEPESPGLFYLPYKFDGSKWTEFPQESAEYKIRTEDGPHSQRDDRRWATGRIEYTPVLSDVHTFSPVAGRQDENLHTAVGQDYVGRVNGNEPATAVIELLSPWVFIDATLKMDAAVAETGQRLEASLSTDGGASWTDLETLAGPFRGTWEPKIPILQRSEHGTLTPVSGKYGFLLRLQLLGAGDADSVRFSRLEMVARFQHSPRSLPALAAGDNDLRYSTGGQWIRREVPLRIDLLDRLAERSTNVRRISENGQDILWPAAGKTGEIILPVSNPSGGEIAGVDAGARFLDLRDGIAPDKLTAETRRTKVGAGAVPDSSRHASISWSLSPTGPFATLWEYKPGRTVGKDGLEEKSVLRWPEIDRTVSTLPPGTRKVYVRYALENVGMDSVRLAARVPSGSASSPIEITHVWTSEGVRKEHERTLTGPSEYRVQTGNAPVTNHSLVLYCPPAGH
jgi:hypothetical protein